MKFIPKFTADAATLENYNTIYSSYEKSIKVNNGIIPSRISCSQCRNICRRSPWNCGWCWETCI